MRLLCLNVALFEKNNPLLTDFLQKNPFDILALQEVTKRVDSAALADFVSKDAIDTATPDLIHQFYAPKTVLKEFHTRNFHKKASFDAYFGGFMEFGLYLRSRYEITYAKNVFVKNHFSLVTDFTLWPSDECRGVQVSDLKIKDRSLRIINYHGIWSKNKLDSPESIKISETILELASEVKTPVIICGDFNLFPNTESIKMIGEKYQNLIETFNIQTTRPSSNELSHLTRNVVDYIFVSKDIKVLDFAVIPSDVSDHLSLTLEFELN